MSVTQGWADLTEGLLHSVIAQLGLGSALDLLTFAATCRSWGAAFSDSLATFPPLLLQPDVPFRPSHPSPLSNNMVPKYPYVVTDIAKVKQDNNLNSEILQFLECLCFIGASFGHVILYKKKSCTVVGVLRHVIVSPPDLPVFKCAEVNYGPLTAPLTSTNSHLIVETGPYNLFWRVGSHSWVRCSTPYGTLKQILVFEGQVFGMDSDHRIFKVQLTPEISMQELPVMESSMINRWHLSNAWLVVCGDMLLLVGFRGPIIVSGVTFEVFRLDLSSEPALWLKVENVENHAIFISTDKSAQPLSCMNPEIWGGRSNCIYCYCHEAESWVALELGKPLQGDGSKLNPNIFIFMGCDSRVQPMWVVPSMLSLCRRWCLP